MQINAVLIDPKDNVVVVTRPLDAGGTVAYFAEGEIETFRLFQPVPIYHKAARREMKKGTVIVKYGEKIGIAACDISQGSYVHIHNIAGLKPEEQN
ncbi:UxaA family hydrolase [Marasmitruncus massiliensis]|uniref:UxaA family hydrolase n=1 Tax=Marasmitruncus massiliensis TaxID=1944642 RepID=UPI000C7E1BA9|nr:UxaA family hydrolase [Marasmitruncus massiliensis]